jgi:site-specific DNA recombinase
MSEKSHKKAFLYVRTSTTDQKNSIENQERDLIEYCDMRGIMIVDKFIDFGKSGKDITERPEFKRMMKLVEECDPENPVVDMVLCAKLDRFARSILDLLVSVRTLNEKNIRFNTLTHEFETVSPTGKLLVGILALFADFERDIIGERTREGYRAAIAKGKLCHRPKKEINKKRALEYTDKGISATAVAKIVNVTPNTMKSRLQEWGYQYDDNEHKWITKKGDLH